MDNEKVKQLVDKGVCVSFGEARRLVYSLSEERLEEIIKKRDKSWGRKPKRIIKRIVWPKGNPVIGIA